VQNVVIFMSQQLGGQQILILKEGSTRTRGRDAQGMNITAAKAVASAVRTTLGPKGMDKMLVDTIGDVVITNDGVTILKEMDIEHPAAKMMVEVAKTQDDEVGDGTTTAVVIAGELLKKAEDLLEQDVHPTIIAAGYRQAAEKAQQLLKEIAFDIKVSDKTLLKNIAGTAMTGKGAEASKDKLCDLVVKAITMVTDEDGTVDIENIKVEKKTGGSIEDSEIVEGVIIDKERVHPTMPKTVVNAKPAVGFLRKTKEVICNNSLIPTRPCAATMPSSAICARKALISWVRCRIKRSRVRCCINWPCCSADLACTKRIVGRRTASQIASASAASFLLRLT
jgi:chaperonin GroEL (HSP60 family)